MSSPAAEDNGKDEKKRAKTSSLLQELLSPDVVGRVEDIRQNYADAKPYPYAQIQNLFEPDFLTSVKEEVKSQSKVNFKESDLYRVFQSIDLANVLPESELAKQLPNTMRLREVLCSQEWRSFVERVAGLPPSTLTDQIDCAFNCHAPGCHLLGHDDVIGTRKVSYILYMTEPDWKEEEGGSLELYGDQSEKGEGGSCCLPVARAWPFFNSIAFFEVQPGFSFHSVQEVLGDRPRLSLQGWYHATEPPKNIEQATRQQLKVLPGEEDETKMELQFKEEPESTEATFSDKDKQYLSKYLKDEFLTEESMAEIQKKFEEDSSVQLRSFLQDKWVPKVEPKKPIVYDDDYYKYGVSSEWKLRGPVHKQRYLEYQAEADSVDDCQVIGSLLQHVKTKVFESEEMARYLRRVTSLDKPTGVRSGQIRRFRPGLDYTVAHYGLLVDQCVLDATMCFVHDDNDEKEAWESGDCGGFECYIEADDDEEGTGPADEYNEEDDTKLLSINASNNTLSLVYRDPGTMRFVKYVGSTAPSSRYDICMEYRVPEQPEGEDDEMEEGAENGDAEEAQQADSGKD